MQVAVAESFSFEARLSRLALMPPDVDQAIVRVKIQVRSAWSTLGISALPLVPVALRASATHLPALASCRADSLDDLLRVLDGVLAHHHPEEIRVASFALLCGLTDLVREELGAPRALELVVALESALA